MTNTTYGFPERLYRSNQGRWMSPDPAGMGAVDPSDPQTWNRYAYVRNSPLNRVDPQGLDDWGEGGVVGTVAAGVMAVGVETAADGVVRSTSVGAAEG
jgi:RHS repeat-associated protein